MCDDFKDRLTQAIIDAGQTALRAGNDELTKEFLHKLDKIVQAGQRVDSLGDRLDSLHALIHTRIQQMTVLTNQKQLKVEIDKVAAVDGVTAEELDSLARSLDAHAASVKGSDELQELVFQTGVALQKMFLGSSKV